MDKLEIWNGALFLLDHSSVSTTAPDSEAARMLNAQYGKIVETCLEAGAWDFAKARGELSRVSPAPAFGYSYYYQMPADWRRKIFISATGDPNDPLLGYTIDGRKIATDAERVFAVWVSGNVTETPGIWSTSFARFVEASLAEACLKLNPGAAQKVADAVKKWKPQAEGVDAVQSPPEFRRMGQWASAARGWHTSREQGR